MTDEKAEAPSEEGKCGRCHERPATEPHTCPYQSEINDDDTTLCDCCDDCEGQCRDDI